MILQVFSVLDKAVGNFNSPMFLRSKGEALRSFHDACQDEKSSLFQHPEDYFLMFLGEYDDGTGTFACGVPERVLSAVECRSSVGSSQSGAALSR